MLTDMIFNNNVNLISETNPLSDKIIAACILTNISCYAYVSLFANRGRENAPVLLVL